MANDIIVQTRHIISCLVNDDKSITIDKTNRGDKKRIDQNLYILVVHSYFQALAELLQDEKELKALTDQHTGGKTALTLAASLKRNEMCVELLLPRGGLGGTDHLQWTALHYAASQGNVPLIKAILDHPEAKNVINARNNDENTPLLLVLRKEGGGKPSDYQYAFELLMEFGSRPNGCKVDVDAQDMFGNTALHHAVYGWDEKTIMELLCAGARMWIRNRDGEVPIAKIPSTLLWEFLDSKCLSIGEQGTFGREHFELEVDYSFLTPDVQEQSEAYSESCERPRPETCCLWWMTQTPGHMDVLRHPVVKLFLHLKWQKIFWLFFAHCLFYVVYLVLLFVYLIWGAFPSMLAAKGSQARGLDGASSTAEGCYKISLVHESRTYAMETETCSAGDRQQQEVSSVENYLNLLTWEWEIVRWILLGLNSVILILEMFQFLVSPMRYLFGSLVNLFELAMIASVYGFLLVGDVDAGRSIGVLALLFSLSEVTRLFGQMPVISTYVKMFTTIASNFIKFLLWYVILVLVYSLSFLLLFYPNTEFQSPFGSLLKTIAMLTGEYGFENLPFDQYSVVSQLTFVTFVFFVTIVLLNLLTGLAVGETQRIQEKAEVMGYVSQIKLMFYIESMLFRDPEDAFGRFKISQKLAKLCRNFLTLKLYKRLASTNAVPEARKKHSRTMNRVIVDGCIVGRLLDKVIGSSILIFHRCHKPGNKGDGDELKTIVGHDGNNVTKVAAVSCASSVSSEPEEAIPTAKITVMPFEDFHKRVAKPHNELALGDDLATCLIEYVQEQFTAQKAEEEEAARNMLVDNTILLQKLHLKLESLDEKVSQLVDSIEKIKHS